MTRSLPAKWYVDADVFERENQRILKHAWWPAGPEAGVAAAGAYDAQTLLGHRIFLIRGDDGALRAFHNVCRHRASPLLDDGGGRCAEIRCPYHGWLYGLDGRLRSAPRFGVDPERELPDGLLPVRMETWRGVVFVCLSDTAPDLLTWLGSADRLCRRFPPPSELDYHDRFVVHGDANWKTYCDNTVEGYHLSQIHPRLAKALAKGSVEIKSYDEGRVVAFHVNYGAESEGADLRGAEGLWLYRFPGFQLTASARVFKAERIEPLGPAKIKSENWMWHRGLDELKVKDAFDWSRQVVEEDLGICEKVQRNLQTGVFKDGPLSPLQEQHVARFQSLVRAAVDESRPSVTHPIEKPGSEPSFS